MTILFRLAHIARLVRIVRLIRPWDFKELVAEIKEKRAQSALTGTVIVALLTITTAAVVVLRAQMQHPYGGKETKLGAGRWC